MLTLIARDTRTEGDDLSVIHCVGYLNVQLLLRQVCAVRLLLLQKCAVGRASVLNEQTLDRRVNNGTEQFLEAYSRLGV